MSLFNTLRVGASGLSSSSLSLAVIGDNIANLNTTGFKKGSARFADALPLDVATLGGVEQLGMGAVTGNMKTFFSQGTLTGTSSSLDMALSGNGFFSVRDGEDVYYTRDGSFDVTEEGYLVNAAGLRVQGWDAENGVVSGTMGDIQLDETLIQGEATSTISLQARLSSTLAQGNQLSSLPASDGVSGPTMDELANLSDTFSTSTTVYDSLGTPHEVMLVFEQVDAATNTWEYTAVTDGGDLQLPGGTGTDGQAFEIASGQLSFDGDGVLTSVNHTPTATAWTFTGAEAMAPTFDFGANSGEGGLLSVDGDPSTVLDINADGYAAGDLTGTRVESDGTIMGIYDNGQEQALGQLAVATFSAPAGLEAVGGNLFAANQQTGEPAIGVAGEGGRGRVGDFQLESSNVDLEQEFVSMIQAQRTYQANSSVVRTANETLQQLVNLI